MVTCLYPGLYQERLSRCARRLPRRPSAVGWPFALSSPWKRSWAILAGQRPDGFKNRGSIRVCQNEPLRQHGAPLNPGLFTTCRLPVHPFLARPRNEDLVGRDVERVPRAAALRDAEAEQLHVEAPEHAGDVPGPAGCTPQATTTGRLPRAPPRGGARRCPGRPGRGAPAGRPDLETAARTGSPPAAAAPHAGRSHGSGGSWHRPWWRRRSRG